MSSDSSRTHKDDATHNLGSITKNRKLPTNSAEESDDRQTSRGSRESQNSFKSIPLQKVTEIKQLSCKSPPVDAYKAEDYVKRTATTQHSTAPTVITAVLRDLQDEIVRSPDYRQPGPIALVNGDRTIAVVGGDNIYVQSKTKFIPVPRDKAFSPHQDHHFWTYQASKLEQHSPLDVALLVQKIFIPFSSMCFGLLGGVALLQLILVRYLVGGPTDEEQQFFLQSYSKFAELTPLLFYVLLAACIVSVLDRVSVEQNSLVCQPSWVVLVVYVLTLVLTLSCAAYDDMIVLYPQNKTIFQDQMKTQEFVSDWQMLNTLRCLFAILGWILFSLTMPPDLLLQHLLHIKQYEQENRPTTSTRNSLY